ADGRPGAAAAAPGVGCDSDAQVEQAARSREEPVVPWRPGGRGNERDGDDVRPAEAADHRGTVVDGNRLRAAVLDSVPDLGDGVKVLHPSLMYNLFSVFWRQQAPITLVEAFSVFRSLGKLPLGDLAAHLPREYVAVKFYANVALPDTATNRAFIATVLADLTRTTDVVLLNTGQRFDD